MTSLLDRFPTQDLQNEVRVRDFEQPNCLLTPWSSEELMAELKERRGQVKRPEPKYIAARESILYPLYEACERYVNALVVGQHFRATLDLKQVISDVALKCIYGEEGFKWINAASK